MRQRKPANIENDLERFGAPLVWDKSAHCGSWASDFYPTASEVRLDLGCGKGAFIVAAALAEPEVLFVGIDSNQTAIARAAQKVCEAELTNVRLIHANATELSDIFGPGELDRIYLNFNSPFPKKKYAAKRLTHLNFLLSYRPLLSDHGFLDLRTDNVLYWEFTLRELEIAGYLIVQRTDNLHAHAAEWQAVLASEYDKRTTERGALVRSLHAVAGPAPEYCEQTAPLGLIEYLPEDLEHFTDIPYGMEDTVENMRNHLVRIRSKRQS